MNKTKLKTISLVFLLAAIVSIFMISGCSKKETTNSTESKKQDNKENLSTKQKTQMDNTSDNKSQGHVMINLPTMQCGICKENIETAVKKLDGIESIDVIKEEKIAHVNFDKSKTDLSKIESAITSAGYNANDKKADPEAYKKLDDCCKVPKDKK